MALRIGSKPKPSPQKKKRKKSVMIKKFSPIARPQRFKGVF